MDNFLLTITDATFTIQLSKNSYKDELLVALACSTYAPLLIFIFYKFFTVPMACIYGLVILNFYIAARSLISMIMALQGHKLVVIDKPVNKVFTSLYNKHDLNAFVSVYFQIRSNSGVGQARIVLARKDGSSLVLLSSNSSFGPFAILPPSLLQPIDKADQSRLVASVWHLYAGEVFIKDVGIFEIYKIAGKIAEFISLPLYPSQI